MDPRRLADLDPQIVGDLVDPEWYLASYPDVRALGADPVAHFIHHGLGDGRNPNGFFHRTWYQETYPEAAAAETPPLLHYLRTGAPALYNPHPRFDAGWYVRQHPEAAANPLLYHMRVGKPRAWATEPAAAVEDYLPSQATPLPRPPGVSVDVVIPAPARLDHLQRCIDALLTDPDRPPGRIVVVDDGADPGLSAWIDRQAAERLIERLRNRAAVGVLGSLNRGIAAAGTHDVLVLAADMVMPAGGVGRLMAQAYAGPQIASVSPLSRTEGLTAEDTDDLSREVNIARGVPVPAAGLSCMYIRRAVLVACGAFDVAAFDDVRAGGIDFCRRSAAHGWTHRLACDTFVAETDAADSSKSAHAWSDPGSLHGSRIVERYPDLPAILARHALANPAGPFRFAITAAAFRRSGKPTILMVFHGLGGGAQRQMMALVEQFGAEANFLLLFATSQGVALTAPALPDHPRYIAPPDRVDDLVALLQSCGVTRVHLQHLKGLDYDIRTLVHRLGVPFDTTVHDYFAICPQVNLLPWPDAPYCGEPGPAGCNACIAARPADGASEILGWRGDRAWQFLGADRVFCPSDDVRDRLARFGLASRAVVVPHEPVAGGAWPVRLPALRGRVLRVALLGVMANLKGAVAVAAVGELAASAGIEIHIVGPVEGDFPAHARDLVQVTGRYREADLRALLARIKPHVVWFPSPCPETYSYTLTSAIDTGLPIVATAIGSFPARLAGRPLTWVVEPTLSATGWLGVFEQVRAALRQPGPKSACPRPALPDYYAEHYLRPPARRTVSRMVDLREPGRLTVVVVPERRDNGIPTDAAYIQLLQPLDHLAAMGSDPGPVWGPKRDPKAAVEEDRVEGAKGRAAKRPDGSPDRGLSCPERCEADSAPIDVLLADPDTALRCRADIVVTHRAAFGDTELADAIARHARKQGSLLLYDLDTELAGGTDQTAAVARRMLRHADRVSVPHPSQATALGAIRIEGVEALADGLDERLWFDRPRPATARDGVVRILLLGDDSVDAGVDRLLPALLRLKHTYGGWAAITCVGPASPVGLPPWMQVADMPGWARASYPGFVSWITGQPAWDISLAATARPSTHKLLALGALSTAVLASDLPEHRDSLANGSGGMLIGPDPMAWYAAIDWLIRNPGLRQSLGAGARQAVLTGSTLAAQTAMRRAAWARLTILPLGRRGPSASIRRAAGRMV